MGYEENEMRRHTKLFEEFLEPKEQKRYWVVHDYSDGEIYGIYDDEDEAHVEYANLAYQKPFDGWYDDDGDGIERNDAIGLDEVDLSDRDQIGDLFRRAVQFADDDLIKRLVLIGADPLTHFRDEREFIGHFDGDLSWMPADMRAEMTRSAKSGRLFGI